MGATSTASAPKGRQGPVAPLRGCPQEDHHNSQGLTPLAIDYRCFAAPFRPPSRPHQQSRRSPIGLGPGHGLLLEPPGAMLDEARLPVTALPSAEWSCRAHARGASGATALFPRRDGGHRARAKPPGWPQRPGRSPIDLSPAIGRSDCGSSLTVPPRYSESSGPDYSNQDSLTNRDVTPGLRSGMWGARLRPSQGPAIWRLSKTSALPRFPDPNHARTTMTIGLDALRQIGVCMSVTIPPQAGRHRRFPVRSTFVASPAERHRPDNRARVSPVA